MAVRRPSGPPIEALRTAFLRVVAKGDLARVREALALEPQLANAVGPHPYWGGRPQALHVAIEMHRTDIFELLLDAGADVDGTNAGYDHWSPLMLALSRNREDMRGQLLARGARVGLIEALMMKDDEGVEQLLRNGLPADVPNGGSLLSFARTAGAIDQLLGLGEDPQQKDRWGRSAIDAISRLEPEGLELLRHLALRGAEPGPEHFARVGDQDRLALLVSADPSVVRREEVIIAAVEGGHHGLASSLLREGADPNARVDDKSGRTALHCAAWRGDLEMVKILTGAGADIYARDAEHDSTPLGWAETSIQVTRNEACRDVAELLAAMMQS